MRTRLMTALAASALAAAPMLAFVPAAHASQAVPFTDSNIDGSLTLCNTADQAITSGSLLEEPFVWKAVSSLPAPAGYSSGLTSLYAYSPVQYEDPGIWSGEALSGASKFDDAAHPAVQLTGGDRALIDFVGAYPPHWDGVVEIRMYYSGPDKPVHTRPYPADVIQVSGNSWKLLEGGGGSCAGSSAVSNEDILDPSVNGVPAHIQTANSPGSSSHQTQTSTSTTSSRSGQAGGGVPTTTLDSGTHPEALGKSNGASAKSGSSGLPAYGIALIVAAVLAIGGFVAFRIRKVRSHLPN